MINTCVVGMENKRETSSDVVDWKRKYAEDMEKKEEELKNYRLVECTVLYLYQGSTKLYSYNCVDIAFWVYRNWPNN